MPGYYLMVPANRIGHAHGMSGFQMKITQEVITLVVLTSFALLYLREPLQPQILSAIALLRGAVYVMFRK